jgi:excisionase family DNA binding protein
MINHNTDRLLTITEVSALLHVHPNTLRRWNEEGRIISYRINSRGDRRFKPTDVQNFLNRFNPYHRELLPTELKVD